MDEKKETCGCSGASVETQQAASQTKRDRASREPEGSDRFTASSVSTGCGCSETQNSKPETQDNCCGGPIKEITKFKDSNIKSRIKTAAGEIPVAGTRLSACDVLGNLLVRLGVNRNNYAVKPGIYAVGNPDDKSPVLVSANYKMSFDALRKELGGINAWILVLDSKGVNVWCAAGKGTFGTEELVNRIAVVELGKIVSHRNVIAPQLGAPGIEAHTVKKNSGFKVIYGPVEARDIKAFLDTGMNATEGQRTVTFGVLKRMEVLGIEFVTAVQIFLALSAVAVIAASFTAKGFSLAAGFASASYFIGAMAVMAMSATVVPAILLPVLPGRMFSIKGAVSGLVLSTTFVFLVPGFTPLSKAAIILLTTSASAFVFMNFTGTTTFTSLTGVRKEIGDSAPIMIIGAALGLIIQIVDFIIKGGVRWN